MDRKPYEPDPVIEFYKKDVDVTLLIENLKKTPDERVQAAISMMELGDELRRARRTSKLPDE